MNFCLKQHKLTWYSKGIHTHFLYPLMQFIFNFDQRIVLFLTLPWLATRLRVVGYNSISLTFQGHIMNRLLCMVGMDFWIAQCFLMIVFRTYIWLDFCPSSFCTYWRELEKSENLFLGMQEYILSILTKYRYFDCFHKTWRLSSQIMFNNMKRRVHWRLLF